MSAAEAVTKHRSDRELLRSVLRGEGDLGARVQRLRAFSGGVRTSEYHVTNACNLRCKGCWFFEYDYDRETQDLSSIEAWRMFAKQQADERGITAALLIGGEPTLYPDRIRAFVEHMPYVTISSNGLRKLPWEGFENVAIALTLFGGVGHDDRLRAIRPSGQHFDGLLDQVLDSYRDDVRATFIYALSAGCLDAIEPTVRRIRDNGNVLSFNYYSEYGTDDPLQGAFESELLDEALRVRDAYPETVINTPFYIRTLITGSTPWASFGYDVCPGVSTSHPAHVDRLQNGNPVLPGFNSYAADGETLNFCCTSGHCEGCRDSQAVFSWLLLSMKHFLDGPESLETWLDIAETYWGQFRWAPYHRVGAEATLQCASL